MRAAAWPSLYSSWRFWPFVHALTYSIVPLHLRVLWVDVVEVAWVAILATCTAKAAREDVADECSLATGACNESLYGVVQPTAGVQLASELELKAEN